MKVWNRIITSLKRNFNHSLIMFFIVFVLGNVLFASIAVSQTSAHVDENMKNRVPSGISIEENVDRYVSPYVHSMLINLLDKIEEEEDITKIVQLNHLVGPSISQYKGETFIGQNIILTSNDLETLNEGLQMVEGRKFEESDLNDHQFKIILDEYEMDEYDLGDKYVYEIVDYIILDPDFNNPTFKFIVSKEIEFEVIGFSSGYDYVSDAFNYQDYRVNIITSGCANEMMQMQNDTLNLHPIEEQNFYAKFIGKYDDLESQILARKSFIYINGMDAVDRIEPLIKKDDLYDNASFILRTSSQDYRYIQAPLENLKALANVTMWASVILVISLLSLVSALFVRNRRQEIGILMSLGETKFKLIMQFACEIILVGLLATSVSMVSGNKLGSIVSNEFMKIQIDTEAEIEYQEDNKGAVTQLDMLEAYKVELNAEYVVAIYASSIVILLLSTMVPMVFVLKTNPKKVLL